MVSAFLTFAVGSGISLALVRAVGVYAFPVATSAAAICTAVVMSLLLQRRFGSPGWRRLSTFGRQYLLASCLSAAAFAASWMLAGQLPLTGTYKSLAVMLVTTVTGFGCYVGVSALVRLIQHEHLYGLLRKVRQ
jgi:peptidoglycan biosynthesis protein MviN/MurJ (putative lipid II flippase)